MDGSQWASLTESSTGLGRHDWTACDLLSDAVGLHDTPGTPHGDLPNFRK